VDQRNHVLDVVKIGRIHSQPLGVTGRRCGLLLNYYTLVYVHCIIKILYRVKSSIRCTWCICDIYTAPPVGMRRVEIIGSVCLFVFVCVSVCLSDRSHIGKKLHVKFHQIFCICYLRLWLEWSSSDGNAMFCTSGLVDDVMFSCSEPNRPESDDVHVSSNAPDGRIGGEVCRF